jgi:hypothetical protein
MAAARVIHRGLTFAALAAVTGICCSCGNSGNVGTVVRTMTAPPVTVTAAPTATTSASSASRDCDALGINYKQLKEGTCVSGGKTISVVNKSSTVHLSSLDAALNGFYTQASLGDSSGSGAPASGKFVILSITIKNKLHTPQQWQNGQASLFIAMSTSAGNSYSESFAAENGPDGNSCLSKSGALSGGFQPGLAITCDVVFDVPADASLGSRGSTLDIANFGGTDLTNPSQPVLGLIRTYH